MQSFVEYQLLHLLSGDTQYTSDTSVHYDELPTKFTSYLINNLRIDETYKIVPTQLIFQFSIASDVGATTAGRAIWIESPAVTTLIQPINIVSADIGSFITFEYPGDDKSLYVRINDEWKFLAPIATNMIWLPQLLDSVSEIAIVDGTIEDGTIISRRVLNENTATT